MDTGDGMHKRYLSLGTNVRIAAGPHRGREGVIVSSCAHKIGREPNPSYTVEFNSDSSSRIPFKYDELIPLTDAKPTECDSVPVAGDSMAERSFADRDRVRITSGPLAGKLATVMFGVPQGEGRRGYRVIVDGEKDIFPQMFYAEDLEPEFCVGVRVQHKSMGMTGWIERARPDGWRIAWDEGGFSTECESVLKPEPNRPETPDSSPEPDQDPAEPTDPMDAIALGPLALGIDGQLAVIEAAVDWQYRSDSRTLSIASQQDGTVILIVRDTDVDKDRLTTVQFRHRFGHDETIDAIDRALAMNCGGNTVAVPVIVNA